jgi:hypothetical protein
VYFMRVKRESRRCESDINSSVDDYRVGFSNRWRARVIA